MLAAKIGSLTLILACTFSFIQCFIPILNVNHIKSQRIAILSARLFFFLVTLSMICLGSAFFYHDFSLLYVAHNSNLQLPWYYRLTAIWGGHEGSLLLWLWILSAWICAFSLLSKSLPATFRTRVLIILGYIACGFSLFIIITSNPFDLIHYSGDWGMNMKHYFYVNPFDGQDLNPLLQDPGMIVHPPLLYTGYVGFVIVFAFACAGLWQGRLDSLWLKRVRPWTITAWLSLTIGITLGSYWAYYELGWGGWWFWDPVENASFMPWLAGTALIHSLIVAEKRHLFRTWTVFLAILVFTLSIIGTFLVRSGVVTSVHAFASDPTRGLFIIALLCFISLPAFLLLIFKSQIIHASGSHRLLSKETALLLNNWLLIGACLVVLFGTIYPLIIDVLNLGKISVGPPYFNRFIVPMALMMLVILGLGPLLRWKNDQFKRIRLFLFFNLVFAIVIACLLNLLVFPKSDTRSILAGLALGFALGGIIVDYIERIAKRGLKGIINRGSVNGMFLAHFGLIVSIFAITATSLFSDSKDMSFPEGKQIHFHQYQITLTQLTAQSETNYVATSGIFLIKNLLSGKSYTLSPQKRYYNSNRAAPLTESDRLIKPSHDLYLALGEEIQPRIWAVRIQYKPYIMWIWIGGLLIALGGLFALFDRQFKGRKSHV